MVNWIGCSAHQLNTILKNTFSDDELNNDVANLIKNSKRLVERVNKTKKYNICLKNDIDVRFDSKYILIDSIYLNYDKLLSFNDKDLNPFLIKIDFELLKNVRRFLKFFFDCRLILCSDKKSTINFVLPTFVKISDYLNSESYFDSELKEDVDDCSRILNLKTIYKKYLCKFTVSDLHKVATLITPNFKELSNLVSKDEKKRVENILK